nr:hypothetical protein GCM10020063_035090 [Dactylosporangium thailandense]
MPSSSSHDAQVARGADAYENHCGPRGSDEWWCTRYERPPAHVNVLPEHAVAAEIALYAGETETTPGDAWTYRKESHRRHGELYMSVNVCIVACVSLTITSEGGVFAGGSATMVPSYGSSVGIGWNPQPMESMRDQGLAYCVGAAWSGCVTVGFDSQTGKPVFGGSTSLGLGVSGGVTSTYGHQIGQN